MSLAKLSVLHLQRRLCGNHSKVGYIKIMHLLLNVAIGIWTAFSIFTLALQCGVKNPQIYQPDRCVNGVVWYPITILNALTDAALALSLSPVILKLNTKTHMKVKIMCLLGCRLW